MDLRDRVYVVTGGGGAIAHPILAAFSGAGAHLVVADRTHAIAARGAEPFGCLPLEVDLSQPDSGYVLVGTAIEKFGRFDGLIHTVGGFAMGRVHEGDPALYDKMMDLNVRTLWHALRAVVPTLVERSEQEKVERGDGFIA